MKNAIIDPREQVNKIIGWLPNTNPPVAITQEIPNSARVAEVSDQTFPVAAPLFWVSCADNVVADQWYYDTVTQEILVVPAPPPAGNQPSASGAQTL